MTGLHLVTNGFRAPSFRVFQKATPGNPLPPSGEIEKRTAVRSWRPGASLCRWRAIVGCDHGLRVGSVKRCDPRVLARCIASKGTNRTFSADCPGLNRQHSTDLTPHKLPTVPLRPSAAFRTPGGMPPRGDRVQLAGSGQVKRVSA